MSRSRPARYRPIITDAAGRQWRVYEYSIFAGETVHYSVGTCGQYQGFDPLDGGARRSYLINTREREPATDQVLLRHLTESVLYRLDDPARTGNAPQRTDAVLPGLPVRE